MAEDAKEICLDLVDGAGVVRDTLNLTVFEDKKDAT
jgi:hypothetical protein